MSDFYPGPAVKNVPLSMAPQKSQDIIAEFGRPEYAKLIAENPIELSLTPDKLVLAFRRWDEEVGSNEGEVSLAQGGPPQSMLGSCGIAVVL